MQQPISDEEYYSNLPKKHVGAGIFIFDESRRLLIIKPNYKEGWAIPGGGVDVDETPKAAAIRETREEIGLDFKNIPLICVHYTSAQGIKPETLQFAFYGGELNADEIKNITLDKNEHSEFRFVEISEADILLDERIKRRLPFCMEAIQNKNTAYIES
jgi:8-oxo-dGTP diphosphatase